MSGLARTDTGRAAGLGVSVIAANVIALVFTVVFARVLGASDYGSLAALMSAFIILMVPGSALQIAVAREVSASLAAADGARRRGRPALGRPAPDRHARGGGGRDSPSRRARGGAERGPGVGGRRRAGDRDAVDGAVRGARGAPGLPALQARGLEHHRRGRLAPGVRPAAGGSRPRRDRRLPRHRAVVRGNRAGAGRAARAAPPERGGQHAARPARRRLGAGRWRSRSCSRSRSCT